MSIDWNSLLLRNVLLTVVLGLAMGMMLRLLRKMGPGRHVRFWLVLALLISGSYLIVSGWVGPSDAAALKIFCSAAILMSANAVLQLFNLLVWDYALRQKRGISVPTLVVDIIDFIVLAGVLFAILRTVFSVNLNAFLVTSTVVSAVVGLAMQDVLGSVVAGMALQLERPFAVGDWVEISNVEGQVIQMNWRTLTVRTRQNNVVILPNSVVSKQTIANYSTSTPLLLKTLIGLKYDYPPADVKTVLVHAMQGCPDVLNTPPPNVLLKSFDDSSIAYEARFWVNDYGQRDLLLDAMRTRIWYALKRSGMEVPFPKRDVSLHTVTEDFEEKRSRKVQEERYADLRSLPLFVGLSDEQIKCIAGASALQRFTRGEELVHQGDSGDSMYVIKSGHIKVMVSAEGGEDKLVTRLGPGDFFGEMSLLTGEPRSASVVADDETNVLRITKSDFANVISNDASIVEKLSRALSERMQLLSTKVAESVIDMKPEQSEEDDDLIRRIRNFFGI